MQVIELANLARKGDVDHIVVESTGISEPHPVAQTFSMPIGTLVLSAMLPTDAGCKGQIIGSEFGLGQVYEYTVQPFSPESEMSPDSWVDINEMKNKHMCFYFEMKQITKKDMAFFILRCGAELLGGRKAGWARL